ncbi:hypothetical protein Q4Q35_10440 [Flavivirga aquimarina]|uniref:Lipoprotein n=1 Tax=Flavivirga aquimarina TaxID=2027862 RepID=A0ABT8WAR3_9FLAO|nr:hypothetical protein [Flavivirga aquimarina]MDO5970225.1 hypothetical protein [Flavivirga aquimarina]
MNIVKHLIFGFLIMFFSCSEHCVAKYEIVDKNHEIGFYKWQNKAEIETGKFETERYVRIDLDQSDVQIADKALLKHKESKPNPKSRILKELCEYNMQLGGIFDKKTDTKLIYINFFCGEDNFFNEKDDRESNRFYDVRDGGDCYFQGVINSKTLEFKIIMINGEA